MAKLQEEHLVTIKVLAETEESNSAIARRLGVTEGTIRYHRRKMADPQPDGRRKETQVTLDGLGEVVAAYFLREKNRLGKDRAINSEALHQHLVDHHGYQGSARSVRRHLAKHFPPARLRPIRRVETARGAQVQIDWSEHPDQIIDGRSGVKLYAFHMILGWSRMEAVVWSLSCDQLAWHRCHLEAFQRLGGVPAVGRIDNLLTGVSHGGGPWGEINAQYRAFAKSLGFHIDPCQPYSPQAKGKTERTVRTLRAQPPLDGWKDLQQLQDRSDERVLALAKRRRCPATGTTVYEAWAQERPKLRPLPDPAIEPFDLVKTGKVGRDCTVGFEGRRYTVPFVYMDLRVEVRGCSDVVQIMDPDTGLLLKTYPRHTAERLLIDQDCYEGPGDDRVIPPVPLGKMGKALEELKAQDVEMRSIDIYHHLAEMGVTR